MTVIDIVSKDDLRIFKEELLKELTALIRPELTPSKSWLKSREVRKLLGISSGTLQNLRVNHTITFTKVGGTLYYNSNDIQKLLNKGRTDKK
jgi:Helix-turn-helix domain